MNNWTHPALQTLEGYLHRNRTRVVATGADPDEVVGDLRRHIEEEVAALQLARVTENDVRRIVNQIGPLTEEPVETPPEPPSPAPTHSAPTHSVWLMLFGVILPAITISFEWFSRFCAGVFFDPLPTPLHLALVTLVPLANFLSWLHARGGGSRVPLWLWLANGLASGVSLVYAVAFLPISIFGVIGIIYFGLGLLPLAPLFSFICLLKWRSLLKRRQLLREECILPGWGWAMLATVLLLVLLALPGPLTRHWIAEAGSESPEVSKRAVDFLRRWGSKTAVLREAYGVNNRTWLLGTGLSSPELARQVYYRITGKPFNSEPPPLSKFQARGRAAFDEFEWDSALGGENVAGQVKGLSLVQSRFDGVSKADEGWAYLEWILEFKNDHQSRQREARAQVQLPPGAVVSRLTLWVNGEEREAAFAGRAQVREAYQKVAVVQRRDPVLVTTSGPDQVLIQCFPIAAGGGTMKVRLGISSPLFVESANQAALRLPFFLERNFGLPKSVGHSFWLESPQEPALALPNARVNSGKGEKFGLRGQLSDAELASAKSTIRFNYSSSLHSVYARDRKNAEGQLIHQTLEARQATLPARIAIVLDGSEEMTDLFPQIARAFQGLPGKPALAVWLAQDGARPLFRSEWKGRESIPAAVGKLQGKGGQDDLPALLAAWDWADASADSAVLWIHGTQPVLLSGTEMLKQRLDWRRKGGPRIIDVAAQPGPNRIAEQLSNPEGFVALPRLGALEEDLERLFATWSGRRPEFKFTRSASPNLLSAGGGPIDANASSHVVRLWALDQIRALVVARKIAQAVQLAGLYQLVTPVSGAVVLETAQQFQDAGLTPVNPETVPVVPEPGTWMLAIVAMLVLVVYRKIKRTMIFRGAL